MVIWSLSQWRRIAIRLMWKWRSISDLHKKIKLIYTLYLTNSDVKRASFSWAELWLSLSTLFLGAFISALISQIKYEYSFLSILFYSVCPLLGAVFLVLYFMVRNSATLTATALADIVVDNIPDPDEKEEITSEY